MLAEKFPKVYNIFACTCTDREPLQEIGTDQLLNLLKTAIFLERHTGDMELIESFSQGENVYFLWKSEEGPLFEITVRIA